MAYPTNTREHVLLAPYTTFGIGGPARWFIEASNEDQVVHAVQFARERDLPIFVLGGGSNVLISDAGFPGVVIHLTMKGMETWDGSTAGSRLFDVAAGENWDDFVTFAVSQDCGGVECLAGIPGSVGGTPVQNVGAYGQEVSTTIRRVRAFDLKTDAFTDLSTEQCGFGYRRSVFNTTDRDRYIVTRVWLELKEDAPLSLSYVDLMSYFKDQPMPGLAEIAAAVREIRHRKGMLLVPGEADCRSAGSFFKNPVVPVDALDRVAETLGIDRSAIPHYPADDGQVKLPAAWLLERAGFQKGYALGEAAVSTRHTLALTNRGKARAADILALRDQIMEKVRHEFGIQLEVEPVMVGEGLE